jgi:hypothetical protein
MITDTGQALPVKQHPRRVPLSKIQEAEAEIEKMAEQGIIEPTSPWCSPVVISQVHYMGKQRLS